MLKDPKIFSEVEQMDIVQERIKNFEKEEGPITGRMMITETAVPPELGLKIDDSDVRAFEGTFDFYDMAIGIAVNTRTQQIASGLWMTPQADGAEEPSKDWIEFFLEKLMSAFDEDGGYGMPVYSFVTDESDMTIVPTKPSEKREQ